MPGFSLAPAYLEYRPAPMPRPELIPFSDEHLDAAAALLGDRHRRHRSAEPLLSARYEDPGAAREQVEALWREDGVSGTVAARNGQLVGYVLGIRKSEHIWGDNVWVDPAGHAVEEAEDARDLYAAAAARWVDEGRTRHYVVVPAADEGLIDAWFRVGFGAQHALAIRELPASVDAYDGVREADERDVDALVEMAPLLSVHQSASPVFSQIPPDDDEELRKEFIDELTKPEIGNLVAEVDGRIVGNFIVVPTETSSVHAGVARAEGASLLGFAITRPDVRGSGAGLALTNASFAWARARGYGTMATDWRMTNLLSSRFWPRRGFRTTFLRLYRAIP